jgi:uncharacterized protein (TIGR04222 family)
LTAVPFLALYAALFCLCAILAMWFRTAVSTQIPYNIRLDHLDPVALAFLAGGPVRAIDTAIVALVEGGAARLAATGSALQMETGGRTLPSPLGAFQRNLRGTTKLPIPPARVAAALDEVRARLARLGLAFDKDDARNRALCAALPMALLCIFGAVRIYLGIVRHRPVGFLTVMVIGSVCVACWLAAVLPIKTRAGERALAEIRRANSRLARAPSDAELMQALALTGVAVLAGTPYAAYARFRRAAGSGGGGCTGGGCGGGGGGGGCGGCGS